MLIIISDLHLTDASTGNTIGASAFKIFKKRIEESVYKASYRSDKVYRPIRTVDVVLLGDIFDIIRSEIWFENDDIRPWSDFKNNPKAIEVLDKIIDGILENNKDAFDILKGITGKLGREHCIKIPSSKVLKKEKVKELYELKSRCIPDDLVDVKVNLYYMIGNHDWFFYLDNPKLNPIRKKVVDALGLSNKANVPFPWEPFEDARLNKALEAHRVYACHGDKYDPFNYDEDRQQSSIGDAIVVELINRFPKEVKVKMRGRLPDEFVEGLKEIDNVRPIISVPFWLMGLLDNTIINEKQKKEIKDIWNEIANDFLHLDFVRSKDKSFRIDLVDKLQAGLFLSKFLSWENMSGIAKLVFQSFNNGEDQFYRHALSENKFLSNEAKYIVYGHTHDFELIPLNTYQSKTTGLEEQIYINTGTWKPVHRLTKLNERDNKFVNFEVMTYCVFYKGDERKGRNFEIWNGYLDY